MDQPRCHCGDFDLVARLAVYTGYYHRGPERHGAHEAGACYPWNSAGTPDLSRPYGKTHAPEDQTGVSHPPKCRTCGGTGIAPAVTVRLQARE
jgi:hypothetical protein